MIVGLSALAVAGGLLLGRWVASRHRQGRRSSPPREGEMEGTGTVAAGDGGERRDGRPKADESEGAVDWTAFPCALGDVVMRTLDQDEAWLAGAVVLREDAPAAVLFIAPDAAGDRAIYVRPRPSSEVAWLLPVRESVVVGAEPPGTIEIDGLRFERRRRLPLRAERLGTGAPDVVGIAILGEYAAASGEVAIVLIADGVGRAWRGKRLGEGEYEVWRGPDAEP
jgi:hypothetical protein